MRPDVVPLTKDLNGNHVIQKCLNRLDSVDKQVLSFMLFANNSSFMMLLLGTVLRLRRINTVAASSNVVSITQMNNKANNSTKNSSRIQSHCHRINLVIMFFNTFSINLIRIWHLLSVNFKIMLFNSPRPNSVLMSSRR